MEVTNFNITYYSNNGQILPTDLKIISIDSNNFITFRVNHGSKIVYFKHKTTFHYEGLILFEIIHDVPLWTFDYTIKNTYYAHTYTINIRIFLELSLINKYIDISMGLNSLIKNTFEKLPLFDKINDNISFIPYGENAEPSSDFKIKLYDYQKRSLGKMIKMENNNLDYELEYTLELDFHNNNILFDPIKNKKTDLKKYFKLNTSGGVLSDEMGLGKTITSISLIDSNPPKTNCKLKYSIKNKTYKLFSKATLILCPSHLINQWKTEIYKCNPKFNVLTIVTKKDHEKLNFKSILDVDIIITSHQFLMNFKYYPTLHYKKITPSMYSSTNRAKDLQHKLNINILNSQYLNVTEHEINNIEETLLDKINNELDPIFEFFYFHRLILDEGHEIFGEMLSNLSLSAYMSEWLNYLDVSHSWYVSGSPFINFKGIVNCSKFIGLKLIDNENGLEITSSEINCGASVFRNLLTKEYLWNNILEKICIRHRKNDVSQEINLFGYNEHIEWITFTDIERKIYDSKKGKTSDYYLLQLCCHPLIIESTKKIFGVGYEDVDLSVMQDKLIDYHKANIVTYEEKLKKLNPQNQAYYMLKKTYETQISESNYMLSILNKMLDSTLIEEDDKNCSICLEEINEGSITQCGHIYCSECIKNCLKYRKICPMCKKPLEYNQIFTINKNTQDITKKEEPNPLIGKYGSKLGKIILMIRNIIINEDARIIIFSQWDSMLSLIGKTLSENGIANCFVKGNVWSRNNAISKFKNGKTLSGEDNKVIMLSLKNAASGTNLTEATHIFFVEPINTHREERKAIEGQAIGRACRLGQKQKINIFRILVKETIEEDIYNEVYKEETDININL
jgi:SNF2 family DNA or RNA helicase